MKTLDSSNPLMGSVGLVTIRIALETKRKIIIKFVASEVSLMIGETIRKNKKSYSHTFDPGIYDIILSAIELRKLDVTSCNCVQLTLMNCNCLNRLYCSNNSLKHLDVRECCNLNTLDCSNNNLKELLLPNIKDSLNHLLCNNNQLEELNVANFTKLLILQLAGNDFISINLIGCDKLIYIDISNCEIYPHNIASAVFGLPIKKISGKFLCSMPSDMSPILIQDIKRKNWNYVYVPKEKKKNIEKK